MNKILEFIYLTQGSVKKGIFPYQEIMKLIFIRRNLNYR